jgi:hypothetical protein
LFGFLPKISSLRQKHPRVPSLPLVAAFTLRGFALAYKSSAPRLIWQAFHGLRGGAELIFAS